MKFSLVNLILGSALIFSVLVASLQRRQLEKNHLAEIDRHAKVENAMATALCWDIFYSQVANLKKERQYLVKINKELLIVSVVMLYNHSPIAKELLVEKLESRQLKQEQLLVKRVFDLLKQLDIKNSNEFAALLNDDELLGRHPYLKGLKTANGNLDSDFSNFISNVLENGPDVDRLYYGG